MALTIDLPYLAEYSKSGRAGCKKCRENIEKSVLRMAVMVQSPFFDGKTPNWYHYDCFFQRYRPNSIGEIKDFEHLRFEDQKRIENSLANPSPDTKKTAGKRKKKTAVGEEILENKEFKVEYSKSGRANCVICENKIEKKEIRIGKQDSDSEEALKHGPFYRWLHVDCFCSAREELNFPWSANVLANFSALEKADQRRLSKKLPSTGVSPPKKVKIETKVESEDERALKKQSDLIYKYLDGLNKMKKPEIDQLFEHNGIRYLPKNDVRRQEFIADALAFGLPEYCPKCRGSLIFKVKGYICYGNSNGWERCLYTTENPKRSAFRIPEKLKTKYPFLKDHQYIPRQRIVNQKYKEAFEIKENNQIMKELTRGAEVKEEKNEEQKPLAGYNLAVFGISLDKKKVEDLGAKFFKDFYANPLCVISSISYLKKSRSKKKQLLKDSKIPVVSEEFLEKVAASESLKNALMESRIEFWDLTEDEIEERINQLNVAEKVEKVFKSGSKSSGSNSGKSAKLVYKSGGVVDPDSGLEDEAHIFQENGQVYNAILNLVDLTINKNAYYKIQLLQSDHQANEFWIFKSWGRIGTDVGNNKLISYCNKEEAIEEFKTLYFERTKNHWEVRQHFVKYPFCYYPVDVDYGNCDEQASLIKVEESTSNLPNPVKVLISMLFDIQNMKRTMLEFELDLEKMPLGKLSKKRILEACSVLKEISTLLSNDSWQMQRITTLCNKFYSLVPHNCGLERPPLIKDEIMVKKKNEMLESLLEIELAYDIIKDESSTKSDLDPYDSHYQKLNADLEPLDAKDPTFKLIQNYVKNTHAKTHEMYQLEIVNVFKVNRFGEAERFKKFADDPNRMLLWHGSRLTNFVGIISQGLRIAPPEAPCTGYMFGKGIYFADSVSKSANYCCTTPDSNIGLLVLSEVALGNSMERKQAEYITKLPKNYMSVKGIGTSQPDPKATVVIENGLKVPVGKLVENKQDGTLALLYNEYIVYNEDQVNLRYLVQVKFNHKKLF